MVPGAATGAFSSLEYVRNNVQQQFRTYYTVMRPENVIQRKAYNRRSPQIYEIIDVYLLGCIILASTFSKRKHSFFINRDVALEVQQIRGGAYRAVQYASPKEPYSNNLGCFLGRQAHATLHYLFVEQNSNQIGG